MHPRLLYNPIVSYVYILWNLNIQVKENFDFKECLWFLDRGLDECLYQVTNGSVTRAIWLDDSPIVFSVSGSNEHIRITLHNSNDSIVLNKVKDYVESWFDLNRDLTPFYQMAQQDQILAPLVKKYKGLRLIGIESLFESLTWAIIGQQINLTFAYKLKRRLTERYGTKVKHNNQILFLFPNPKDLIGIDRDELLAMQFSRQKADYVILLSNNFVDKDLDKSSFTRSSPQASIEQLTKLKGIGPWTANYVAMKCLKHMDAFPVQDVGLQNALKNQLGLSSKPGIDEIMALSDSWFGWKAYATLYLWRSLNDTPLKTR